MNTEETRRPQWVSDDDGGQPWLRRRGTNEYFYCSEGDAAYLNALEKALSTMTEALIWASGAFGTDELMAAWAKTGRPAVRVGLDVLALTAPGTPS